MMIQVLSHWQTHPHTNTTENNTILLCYCCAGGN